MTTRLEAARAEYASLCLHTGAHPSANGGHDCHACGGKNVRIMDPAVCVRLSVLRKEIDALAAAGPPR